MASHLLTHHKEYASPYNSHNNGRLPLPESLWQDMKIEENEYVKCGINNPSHILSRFEFIHSDTAATVVAPQTPSGKRSRAFTNTMIDIPARKQPRHK